MENQEPTIKTLDHFSLFLHFIENNLTLKKCRELFPEHPYNSDVDWSDQDKPWNMIWDKFRSCPPQTHFSSEELHKYRQLYPVDGKQFVNSAFLFDSLKGVLKTLVYVRLYEWFLQNHPNLKPPKNYHFGSNLIFFIFISTNIGGFQIQELFGKERYAATWKLFQNVHHKIFSTWWMFLTGLDKQIVVDYVKSKLAENG